MESLKKLYKIGRGPSSSHTMGPEKAALTFKEKFCDANSFVVTLFGSLAASGKGHFTDKAIIDVLGNKTKIIFDLNKVYKYHSNGMLFEAFNNDVKIGEELIFSVGGGELRHLNEDRLTSFDNTYPHNTMNEILSFCKENNLTLDEYVLKFEEEDITEYLSNVYDVMKSCVNKGFFMEGVFEGSLKVERKAHTFYNEYLKTNAYLTLVMAASLAVCEVNASSGTVVTAPTCGSSGVVPGVLFAEEKFGTSKDRIIRALMVGGLIGNIVKTNASISGAEVGCQGEIGTASSMASAMKAFLLGASNEVIEYAAEISLEHNLGMTCDPIDGLVLIPCIERNAISSVNAINAASYAVISGNNHFLSFDNVVNVMRETGLDLSSSYKETSRGGLAKEKRFC